MDYKIIENKNNLKSKERFYKDRYLINLIDIAVKYNGSFKLHNYIRDLFYMKSLEEYDVLLTKNLIIHDKYQNILFQIYKLFIDWLPFEKYNMGELRGNYLEILSYTLFQQKYSNNLYKESNIFLKDYKSHTWDLIIEFNNSLQLYECKFSSKTLKRNHINQMIGLKNKLQISKLFLIIYDTYELIEFNIKKLQDDTKKETFEIMINTFNYINIDNFNSKNIG